MLIFCAIKGFCLNIQPPSDSVVIDLSKGKISAETAELLKKMEDNSSQENVYKIIFFAPAGFEMPINLTVLGSVLSCANDEDNQIKLKLNKDIYYYVSSDKNELPLLSYDGKNWGKVTDLFTGVISFGVGVKGDTPNIKPVFNLMFEVNTK